MEAKIDIIRRYENEPSTSFYHDMVKLKAALKAMDFLAESIAKDFYIFCKTANSENSELTLNELFEQYKLEKGI